MRKAQRPLPGSKLPPMPKPQNDEHTNADLATSANKIETTKPVKQKGKTK